MGREGEHVDSAGECKGDERERYNTKWTLSAMSVSSQPVSSSFSWKLLVSSSFIRYSTVVLKSPRIDNSFNATTKFLPTDNSNYIFDMQPLYDLYIPVKHPKLQILRENKFIEEIYFVFFEWA